MEQGSSVVDELPTASTTGDQAGQASQRNHRRSSPRISSGFLIQPLSKASKRKATYPTAPGPGGQENVEPPPDTAVPRIGSGSSPQSDEMGINGVPVARSSRDSLRVFKRRKGKKKERHGRDTPSPQHSQASSAVQSSSNTGPPISIPDDQSHAEVSSRETQPPSIDPAQIVRMALSLNENRRLNLSPGRLPPPSPGVAPLRSTSASAGTQPVNSSGILGGHRETLRTSLGPRPSSSTHSPSRQRVNSSPKPTNAASAPSEPRDTVSYVPNQFDQDLLTAFSAATLSRADKARKYMELHNEYRRLLQVLPPLRPISISPQDQPLGRNYNPLQCIRNRKIRGHVQDMLDPEGAGWNDVDAVKRWVGSTEAKAKSSGFQQGDIAMLPNWNNSGFGTSDEQDPEASFSAAGGNTPATKSKRPKLDWTFTPAGLLADAYWLEKNTNKSLIETRTGLKLFPHLELPKVGADTGSRRTSYESNKFNTPGVFSSPDSNVRQSSTFQRDGSLDVEDGMGHSINASPSSPRNRGIVKRHIFRRRKNHSTDVAESDDSDDESVGRREKVSLGRTLGVNIGPLERHMSAVLKSESSVLDDTTTPLQPSSMTHKDGQQRRGGVSSEIKGNGDAEDHEALEHPNDAGDPRSLRSSVGSDQTGTPKISLDDFGGEIRPNGHISNRPSDRKQPKSRARGSSFFNRHAKAKQINEVEETDFAMKPKVPDSEPLSEIRSSPGSSILSGSRANSVNHFSSPVHSRRPSSSKNQDINNFNEKESNFTSATSRFFKAGRIGELVRGELGHAVDTGVRKAGQQKESEPSSRTAHNDTLSETEDNADRSPYYLTVTSPNEQRSRSTNDLGKSESYNSYNSRNLPTFRSAHAPSSVEDSRPMTSGGDDHISRQMRQQKERYSEKRSRVGRLTPLSIDTTPDVSPNTSTTNLVGSAQAAQSDANTSSRYSAGVKSANSRLNKVLREPGGVGKGGLPITGLSNVDPTSHEDPSEASDKYTWRTSAFNETDEQTSSTGTVTAKDIHRVKALLLSSGVKAQAIVRRANTTKQPISKFLLDAAATANVSVTPQIRREEHVVAARLLSNNLEKAGSSFEQLASAFRNETCQGLHSRLDDLRDRGHSDLALSMQSIGDDADAFISRLTTTHTLAVKQVNDSVDRMIRAKWKRLRWLRRAGFQMLEWLLVGIMWFIWAFVLIVRIVYGAVWGVTRSVKWLFWL